MTNVFDEFGRVARTGVDRIRTFRITTTADAALVDADTTSVLEDPASAKYRVRAVWILPGRTQWIRTAFPFRDWSLFFPAHATPAKSHQRGGLKPSVVPRLKCLINEYRLKSIIKGNPRNRNRSAPRGLARPSGEEVRRCIFRPNTKADTLSRPKSPIPEMSTSTSFRHDPSGIVSLSETSLRLPTEP